MPSRALLLNHLPERISKKDIENFFERRLQGPAVVNVGHIYNPANNENFRRTIVSFSSSKLAAKSLARLNRKIIHAEAVPLEDQAGESGIELDSDFHDLTVLYEPESPTVTNIE
jgi:hypothetical protein